MELSRIVRTVTDEKLPVTRNVTPDPRTDVAAEAGRRAEALHHVSARRRARSASSPRSADWPGLGHACRPRHRFCRADSCPVFLTRCAPILSPGRGEWPATAAVKLAGTHSCYDLWIDAARQVTNGKNASFTEVSGRDTQRDPGRPFTSAWAGHAGDQKRQRHHAGS